MFESPVLTAEYWDKNIADAIKNAGLEGKVTVKKIVSPGIDRTTYAKQLLASGQLPDIMQSINTQEFIDAGILTPWDSKWVEDNYLIPYGNALQGKVWQAPAGAQIIPFFFYNTEMFEKAGVKPPTNWAEFQDVVKKLKDAGFKPLQLVGGGDALGLLHAAFGVHLGRCAGRHAGLGAAAQDRQGQVHRCKYGRCLGEVRLVGGKRLRRQG